MKKNSQFPIIPAKPFSVHKYVLLWVFSFCYMLIGVQIEQFLILKV
jgi:hypothetical protein